MSAQEPVKTPDGWLGQAMVDMMLLRGALVNKDIEGAEEKASEVSAALNALALALSPAPQVPQETATQGDRLLLLLRHLHSCAVNDSRVDPALEAEIQAAFSAPPAAPAVVWINPQRDASPAHGPLVCASIYHPNRVHYEKDCPNKQPGDMLQTTVGVGDPPNVCPQCAQRRAERVRSWGVVPGLVPAAPPAAAEHPLVKRVREVMEHYDADEVAAGLRHFLSLCEQEGITPAQPAAPPAAAEGPTPTATHP